MDQQQEPVLVFMFPYAGGNKYSYNSFLPVFSSNFKVIMLEPPGRGARIKESLLTDLEEIAEDFYQKISPLLDQPYIFYGHSMGSWIAFVVAQKIRQARQPLPLHMFFSGSGNPKHYNPILIRHKLSKEDFFKYLHELGGISTEMMQNKSLLDYFEPILRADFEAVETYKCVDNDPFNVPLSILIGSNEQSVKYEHALAWKSQTTASFDIQVFEGNHFFINQHIHKIVQMITSVFQKEQIHEEV